MLDDKQCQVVNKRANKPERLPTLDVYFLESISGLLLLHVVLFSWIQISITFIYLPYLFPGNLVVILYLHNFLKFLDKLTRNICLCSADPDDPLKTTDQTRRLGLIVCSLPVYTHLI